MSALQLFRGVLIYRQTNPSFGPISVLILAATEYEHDLSVLSRQTISLHVCLISNVQLIIDATIFLIVTMGFPCLQVSLLHRLDHGFDELLLGLGEAVRLIAEYPQASVRRRPANPDYR